MKLQIRIMLLLICSYCIASAQDSEQAFKSGEFLKYRVRYGPFSASYATLQLQTINYHGREVFHAKGYGQTTGLARVFFKVEDTYESYFDKQNGVPYFFNRDIYEGGYTKKLHFFFDHQNQQVQIKNLENQQEKIVGIAPSIKDVISALYYFRNNPKMNHLQINEEVNLDMIFDDDQVFKFRLRFLGKERIDTNFGYVNTLVFRPLVQDGRVFKEQESLTLWVTDDANKIPIKVKASLRVGALIGEIVDFDQLKYPTELKK